MSTHLLCAAIDFFDPFRPAMIRCISAEVSRFGLDAAIAASLRTISALMHAGLEQTSRVLSIHAHVSPSGRRHALLSVQ
jgi:hypothetical protein